MAVISSLEEKQNWRLDNLYHWIWGGSKSGKSVLLSWSSCISWKKHCAYLDSSCSTSWQWHICWLPHLRTLLLQFLKAAKAFQGLLCLYLSVYANITINNVLGLCSINRKFIQVFTVYQFCWFRFPTPVEKNCCEYVWERYECVIIGRAPDLWNLVWWVSTDHTQ